MKKYLIDILLLIFILIILAIVFVVFNSSNNNEMYNKHGGINAVITRDNVTLDISGERFNVSKGTPVGILKENKDDYEIDYYGKKATTSKKNVAYYTFNDKEKYSLLSDVSAFNVGANFSTAGEFSAFIVNDNINYVYIRLGGRGYGTNGNFYYDDKTQIFIDACEYLNVPFGFYFLDEAINKEEIDSEIEFVKSFLNIREYNNNVLPLVIDVEYQEGKGRSDKIWEERVELLNYMIENFSESDIETIVYANGFRSLKYFKDINSKLWLAYYPLEGTIPKEITIHNVFMEHLKDENSEDMEDSGDIENSGEYLELISQYGEFFDKIIAWQFSDRGAVKDGINEKLDLSIVDNDYFKNFRK